MERSSIILYIDDDLDDIELFSTALQEVDQSLTLLSAASGREGIEKLIQLNKENRIPSLILLDFNMPGMNGKDTLLAIKEMAFYKLSQW